MIIDGKEIAQSIQEEIKERLRSISGRPPCLVVIQVGDNSASTIYIRGKTKACENVGIHSIKKQFPNSITEVQLVREIELLNKNPAVDGILVQLPLPEHIRPLAVNSSLSPSKDVDGFHPMNLGKMLMGETDGFFPCTPRGIQVMLMQAGIDVAGMNALVIGRSNIVGKPMAALLMQNTPGGNATVTVAHQHTKNLKEISLKSDLIIAAIGKPKFLTAEMVKKGAIVIDVGVNRIKDSAAPKGNRIVGDADFEALKEKCSYITPVPGGVGPMTIAMLLSNTMKSYLQTHRQ